MFHSGKYLVSYAADAHGNARRALYKVSNRFQQKLASVRKVWSTLALPYFMKIRLAILELLHAEGQTDGDFSLLGVIVKYFLRTNIFLWLLIIYFVILLSFLFSIFVSFIINS
jgi:hypothetical protein